MAQILKSATITTQVTIILHSGYSMDPTIYVKFIKDDFPRYFKGLSEITMGILNRNGITNIKRGDRVEIKAAYGYQGNPCPYSWIESIKKIK